METATDCSESEVNAKACEDEGRFATVQALIDLLPPFLGADLHVGEVLFTHDRSEHGRGLQRPSMYKNLFHSGPLSN